MIRQRWQNPDDWTKLEHENGLWCEHVFPDDPTLARTSHNLAKSGHYIDNDGWQWEKGLSDNNIRPTLGEPVWLCNEHFQQYVIQWCSKWPELAALRELQRELGLNAYAS